jgi:hypothetical protein
MPSIPSLPGRLVAHRSEEEVGVKRLVANLCQLNNDRCVHQTALSHFRLLTFGARFPGSQPVSFGTQDLQKLESQEYVARSLSAVCIVSCLMQLLGLREIGRRAGASLYLRGSQRWRSIRVLG